MKRTLRGGLLFGLIAAGAMAAAPPVLAAGEEDDPVFVFNRICYAQVPNLDQIRDMARRLAWHAIESEDLKKFTTIDAPEVLEGWDAQVGERVYRVAIVRAALSRQMKQTFPKLGNGKATSCMVVLDERHDAAVFGANMAVLAGKPPASKDVREGDLLTTTWAGGNDALKVFLISKAGKDGKGGLLNVTVLTREDYVGE